MCSIILLFALLFSCSLALPLSEKSKTITNTTGTCNGHASLCNQSYANVVYAGAHNSYAVGSGISDNQNLNASQALVKGIRLLQNQGHDNSGIFNISSSSGNDTNGQNVTAAQAGQQNPSQISLCHTSCYLEDGGYLESWLAQAKSWLDVNPNEVITLLLTNPDHLPYTRWEAGLRYAGFNETNVWAPANRSNFTRDQWPTLGDMISSGKRTVIAMDYEANETKLPWLLDEFAYMWENPYDQLSYPFNCSLDRGSKPQDKLYFMNHVKDVQNFGISTPDKANLNITNAQDGPNGVVETVDRCTKERAERPTYVLVDFFDVPATAGVLAAMDQLNNVSITAPTRAGKSAARPSSHHPPLFPLFLLALSLPLALSHL